MPEIDRAKLDELLAYLDKWRAAEAAYFAWIGREFQARRARFQQLRKKARNRLLDGALSKLLFDRDGRAISGTAKANAAKWRFRFETDRTLAALVEGGEEIFGIKGERDRAGIYIGTLDTATRRLALKRLKEAFTIGADQS